MVLAETASIFRRLNVLPGTSVPPYDYIFPGQPYMSRDDPPFLTVIVKQNL